jgi:hypothetical protein
MTEADALLAALDVASDDEARAALVANCPKKLLEQLHAALFYRKFIADSAAAVAAERAAFAAFTSELDAAPDDAARLHIIEAARRDPEGGEAFVAEWTWRRTATEADWAARYFAMLGREVPT